MTLIVQIKDLKTGKVIAHPYTDISVFQWTENNWTCDCNRCIGFGEEVEKELEEKFGEYCCFGEERFIVVGAEGGFEGMTVESFIDACNRHYPLEEK